VSIAGIGLSVVIPAYNEALRLPPYLAAVREHLHNRYGDRYEVLVVDDGSSDGLLALLEPMAGAWPQLRCLRHFLNQGKGAAVRTGVLEARGDLLLFADADGATPIAEERRLAAAIDEGADLAIASRLARGHDVERNRAWTRAVSGRLFAQIGRRMFGLAVQDTQCGFKMFRGEVGHRLFSMACETRYLFDLELLVLATRLGYRIAEVPVHWTEVPGGHLHPVADLPRIMLDLWRLRRRLHDAVRQG
jgi:dolichyl-phosphate beta-glucosyltransferase